MLKLQAWVVGEQRRMVVLLEGLGRRASEALRSASVRAWRSGMCRVVTLDPPDRQQSAQWPFQRYVERFPTAGKITIFDGSWYHAPALRRTLGLCSEAEFAQHLHSGAELEAILLDTGITLVTFWFSAGDEEQEQRFPVHMVEFGKHNPYQARTDAPESPVPVADVRGGILSATDTGPAPRYVVQANDKRDARLECMRHLLSLVPAPAREERKAKAPARG